MSDLHERIRERAYELWEEEGRPDGRADAHWSQAEAELAGVHGGDEAPPDAAEHVCPACNGTGQTGRTPCKTCGGTGRTAKDPQP